jgi:ABC-type bacteriocin/lantibiotic exporter with double-glycine peptidase domain
MLVALQILLMFFIAPFKNFIQTYQNLKHLQRSLGRLEDVGQAEIDRAFEKKEKLKPRFAGGIEFKDVTFGYYPFAPPYLDNISLQITPGKWVGITGLISSGKSTLGKLAAALVYPWKGEILYDGCRWDEIEENHFRESIGWISQDGFVFAGSLRENITLWDPSITDSEFVEVCRVVGIQIPKNHWISEDGKNLSYSERQQIEIARVFLRKPSLLIIDEGLNTLTPPQQKNILGHLKELKCTSIFITYQKTVLDACDEVIIMKQGKMRR